MSVEFYHVDAFTTTPFSGNPAAVLVLKQQSHFDNDKLLQSTAAEFNLPATAFLLASTASVSDAQEHKQEQVPQYQIKWFSPTNRIPICGHGTLAASHILFELNKNVNSIQYDGGPVGSLTAKLTDKGEVELEFPACQVVDMDKAGKPVKSNINLEEVLKSAFPEEVKFSRVGRGDRGGYIDMMLVELEEGYPLKEVQFNNSVLAPLFPEIRGIIFTTRAKSDNDFHFHSRVIHAEVELGEDQATGSAHCMLAPYWHQQLSLETTSSGKDVGEQVLKAAQVSKRGGIMNLVWKRQEMRCLIRSSAVTLAKGTINIDILSPDTL